MFQIIISILIVLAFIMLQLHSFVKNRRRMEEYGAVFEKNETLSVNIDDAGFVQGIGGYGNKIYQQIQNSINKYLENNKGSVIDFHLLKDAVDRHCDAVEEEINSQTPVPLYLGLAGTMIGVIIGLVSLLASGSLTALMGTTSGINNFDEAAGGINDLLSGVACAMTASFCGIILTTISSQLFKKYKQKEEKGKNTFLAWMQSMLLPELPSNTSEALMLLVQNLNRFNKTFSSNTDKLGAALNNVNESYSIQADIIKTVQEMDVEKIAKANVQVLTEFKTCTDKLEKFNKYLSSVKGYTDTIQKFNAQFSSEANRLHILEEIRDFFQEEYSQIEQRKADIAKSVADVDDQLKQAMDELGSHAHDNLNEMTKNLEEQGERFKHFLLEETEMFNKISTEVNERFAEQLKQTPQILNDLEGLSALPKQIEILSNAILNAHGQMTMQYEEIFKIMRDGMSKSQTPQSETLFPRWMRWSLTISTMTIALFLLIQVMKNIPSFIKSFIYWFYGV